MRTARILAVSALFALTASTLTADVKMSSLFQDDMVLQNGMKVPVWGSADPGEDVKVEFAGQTKSVKAAQDGKWLVALDPLKVSAKGSEMKVSGKNTVVLGNILVGEVWVASGQSNMDMALGSVTNGKDEVANSANDQIRYIKVKNKWAKIPQESFEGKWLSASPQTTKNFSAVAFFFARELNKRLNVPVGIIQSSWGGTPAEAWTPLETLRAKPELYGKILEAYDKFMPLSEEEIAAQRAKAEEAQRNKDTGNLCEARGWAKTETDTSDWRDIKIPGYLETVYTPSADGSFWVRRDIEIPESWAGSELILKLGPVDDLDTTYFNGVKVGATSFDVKNWWDFPRVYKIDGKLVKTGKNTIAVRIFDERFAGGMPGPEIQLVKNGEKPIDLAGTWKIREETVMKPLPAPNFPYLPHIGSYLYNGMIAPVVPFAVKGAIWYQGENNAGRAIEYRTLFKDMINAWREKWKQDNFSFHFVQLANYMKRLDAPSESNWALLREAQTMALELPKTGMAVSIDIGDGADIHPKNKQDVGLRLALNALAKDYGMKDIVFSGPMYKSLKIEGDKARIKFDFAEGLKAKDGDAVKGFAVCGEDQKFVWADAKIEGDEVVVWSNSVKTPVAVRYAWANNPECNLYNAAGLPASPFRTDDFPAK